MAVHVDRSLRLPESEYFADPQAKTGIALHHTVCDSAHTTLDIWRRDCADGGKPRRVATAFVVDLDGTIYEAFDPACWAWQFGLSWRDDLRLPFEKRFIGIEITSEGGLTEHDGRLYAYDRVAPMFRGSRGRGDRGGEGDAVKPAPWSADNGLAATDSRLRSVDIRHSSVDNGRMSVDNRRMSVDNGRMSVDNRRMSGTTDECPSTTDECPRTSP